MQDKIVGKASVGLLLFLPLVAVGIALALMLTWGHQNAQQASADATPEIELHVNAGGRCDPATAGAAASFAGAGGAFANLEKPVTGGAALTNDAGFALGTYIVKA